MQGTIYGKVPSKSNCYKVACRGGYAKMYKGKDLKLYEAAFASQIKTPNKPICGAFSLELDTYYPSKRADLDNGLKIVLDSLQSNGVIENDRNCVEIIARRHVDKDNPRIEFSIKAHNDGS